MANLSLLWEQVVYFWECDTWQAWKQFLSRTELSKQTSPGMCFLSMNSKCVVLWLNRGAFCFNQPCLELKHLKVILEIKKFKMKANTFLENKKENLRLSESIHFSSVFRHWCDDCNVIGSTFLITKESFSHLCCSERFGINCRKNAFFLNYKKYG